MVFFVLDVSQPNIATWGEYIRWVGAAAASVVVWEWVERIEALERDEKKDGILGREIFDGDEMLDMGSDHHVGGTTAYLGFGKRTDPEGEKKVSILPLSSVRPRMPFRKKGTDELASEKRADRGKSHNIHGEVMNGVVTRPSQVATPISRSDTTSAASTVYAVRYQNVSSPSPAIPEEPQEVGNELPRLSAQADDPTAPPNEAEGLTTARKTMQEAEVTPSESEDDRVDTGAGKNRQVWQAVANPFKRKRTEPPAEVAAQMAASNIRRSPAQTYHNLRDRLTTFRKGYRGAAKERAGPSPPMPVTVIPAQPRRSRLDVPGETSRTSRHPSVAASQRDRKSSSSRSRRESLPVTVIPAPRKGGRTWSPEDMKVSGGVSSRQKEVIEDRHDSAVHGSTTEPPSQATEASVVRSALTIAETSLRSGERSNRNSPASNRSVTRLRAPTIDSLNDRLGATSSASAAADSNRAGGQSRHSYVLTTNGTPSPSTPHTGDGNRKPPDPASSPQNR